MVPDSTDSDNYTYDSETEEDEADGHANNGNDWTADDERIYRDNLEIMYKLHWGPTVRRTNWSWPTT